MGTYLNPSNAEFKMSKESKIFVDKSYLIHEVNSCLNTNDCFFCVSRPRRFSKTTNLNMLSAYYSRSCDSKDLFKDLEIAKDQNYEMHLNAYDVIQLDISDFICFGNDLVSELQRKVIQELQREYTKLELNSCSRLVDTLTLIHDAYGIEYIFLIDEWDVIFRDFKDNAKLQTEYLMFLKSLFKSGAFSRHVKLAYLTGILPIRKTMSHSAMNNFEEYSIVDSGKLAPYFGFTEKEVQILCAQFNRDFEEMKEWYDGYNVDGFSVYNPKSVCSSLEKGKVKSYWTRTLSFESLKAYVDINYDGIREALSGLISGKDVRVDTDYFLNDFSTIASKDDVLTSLIHLGYLTYDWKTSTCWIPNKEIRMEFEKTLRSSNKADLMNAIENSNILLNCILRKDTEEVVRRIQYNHENTTSLRYYNNEHSLALMLRISLYGTIDRYHMFEEFEVGLGYADLVMIPKKENLPTIVIECKWNKDPIGAIEQIKNKHYTKHQFFTKEIVLVGINYDKKTKEHTCIIEEITNAY